MTVAGEKVTRVTVSASKRGVFHFLHFVTFAASPRGRSGAEGYINSPIEGDTRGNIRSAKAVASDSDAKEPARGASLRRISQEHACRTAV